MAKKKAAKKRMLNKGKLAKTATGKKKGKSITTKKRSNSKTSAKTASHTKRTRKTTKPQRRTRKPTERLEKMTISIEQGESGDLVVTESGGGAIQVRHTVHRDESVTPIPGKSYNVLKALGAGSHEIEIIRTIRRSGRTAART